MERVDIVSVLLLSEMYKSADVSHRLSDEEGEIPSRTDTFVTAYALSLYI